MTGRAFSARGFSLLEIVVVVAVIAALAAVLTPLAFSYLQDAKRTQAENDATQIAAAVTRFLRDTSLPPYKNTTSATKSPAKESADYECLFGGQGSAFSSATDSTSGSWSSCYSGSTTRDTVENHLIANAPGGDALKKYETTGKTAWKGPYLPTVPADPWGNQYLINIGKADPAASTPKAVWVVSAGSNGLLETTFDKNAASTFAATGDDIIARLK